MWKKARNYNLRMPGPFWSTDTPYAPAGCLDCARQCQDPAVTETAPALPSWGSESEERDRPVQDSDDPEWLGLGWGSWRSV